ncbi:hypothetical protein CJ030_MR3G002919 [Morella rubra]|uniref:Retrovirus-related Pol polyprotein from transposon TNT 1-94 n=1 Tax=Morella rubra TaxID=262757 RepID=A0A6A1WAI4_9ROSI|nr:hypothetical protein CJ030_MR3G002919 [Morella rubra]
MHLTKPIQTPMATTGHLCASDGAEFENPTLYRSTIGSLQYLSFMRPDLAYAVNCVCQYMHAPCVPHWQAVKRILRYLRHTVHFGLFFARSFASILATYSDADWAGCLDDRRSTGGLCIYLGSHLISWSSCKQPTIARSSTEAKYKAVANATCELPWIQSLFRDLGVPLTAPPVLWCDNLGATYLSANPVMHSCTKHVHVDFHFVRNWVASGSLVVSFVSNKDQLADVLTKPLSGARFTALCTSLSVLSLPLSLRGDVEAQSAAPMESTSAASSMCSNTSSS